MNKTKFFVVIVSFLLIGTSCQNTEYIQITLISDKESYQLNEPIKLKYKALWLGKDDAVIYLNRFSFPELEILYLNRDPLVIQKDSIVKIRKKPGRHEIHLLAPTMETTSDEFYINLKSQPTQYLNGMRGYYKFDKIGSYVIRTKFDIKSPWKLSDKQKNTIFSNYIIIQIEKKQKNI